MGVFDYHCSLLIVNCFSQSITWQRTYDGVDGIVDNGFDICFADSGNLYIAGGTTFLPNDSRIYVLKINRYGDTIWTETIDLGASGGERALAIVPSGDGGCVVTGDANFAFAIKLDMNGNIIWIRNYGGFFKQCYRIIRTSDGGYIACGRDADCSTDCSFVIKVDSLGNLQWQRTYSLGYISVFYDIEESIISDGFIVGGAVIEVINDRAKALIMKLNLYGEIVWERRYQLDRSTVIYSLAKMSDYYVAGGTTTDSNQKKSIFINRLNDIGDTDRSKIYYSDTNEYFGELEVKYPNKIVIGASKIVSNSIYGYAMIVDTNSNVLTERLYPSNDFIIMHSVLPLQNGDVLFVGTADFDTVLTKEDIYALRTDSLLNTKPVIGIQSQNLHLPEMFKLHQNYPNPFNPVTMIKYDIPTDNLVNVKVYDLLGKEVFSSSEYKTAGSYEVRFDGTNLASGMYFYSIDAGKFRDVKKMVLIK